MQEGELQSDESDGGEWRPLMCSAHSKHIPGPFDAASDGAPACKGRKEEPSRAFNRKLSSLCGGARVALSPHLGRFRDAGV